MVEGEVALVLATELRQRVVEYREPRHMRLDDTLHETQTSLAVQATRAWWVAGKLLSATSPAGVISVTCWTNMRRGLRFLMTCSRSASIPSFTAVKSSYIARPDA